MISKSFILAGKAIFTIKLPEELSRKYSPHYTFKINKKDFNDKSLFFVNLLTGPNNMEDYTYMGLLISENGKLVLTRNSKFNSTTYPVRLLTRFLEVIWQNEGKKMIEAGFNVYHEGRCGRCGRRLTTPTSLESGFGPECINFI